MIDQHGLSGLAQDKHRSAAPFGVFDEVDPAPGYRGSKPASRSSSLSRGCWTTVSAVVRRPRSPHGLVGMTVEQFEQSLVQLDQRLGAEFIALS